MAARLPSDDTFTRATVAFAATRRCTTTCAPSTLLLNFASPLPIGNSESNACSSSAMVSAALLAVQLQSCTSALTPQFAGARPARAQVICRHPPRQCLFPLRGSTLCDAHHSPQVFPSVRATTSQIRSVEEALQSPCLASWSFGTDLQLLGVTGSLGLGLPVMLVALVILFLVALVFLVLLLALVAFVALVVVALMELALLLALLTFAAPILLMVLIVPSVSRHLLRTTSQACFSLQLSAPHKQMPPELGQYLTGLQALSDSLHENPVLSEHRTTLQ
mmetsp:Transcript_10163/g.21512  ORF Transcript_10163/g.21512 Transcript_10163/m.21512 type:complete len:277 (-) Transcript_10163:312-1142(-)